MLLIGIDIILFGVGVYILVQGRFTVARDRIVEGGGARLLGVVLCAPLPLLRASPALARHFLGGGDEAYLLFAEVFISWAMLLSCTILAYLLARLAGKAPVPVPVTGVPLFKLPEAVATPAAPIVGTAEPPPATPS